MRLKVYDWIVVCNWAGLLVLSILLPHLKLTFIGLLFSGSFWNDTVYGFWDKEVLVVGTHLLVGYSYAKRHSLALWISGFGAAIAWIPYPFTYLWIQWALGVIVISTYVLIRYVKPHSKNRDYGQMIILPVLLFFIAYPAVFFDT
jgi:hypothetical protein